MTQAEIITWLRTDVATEALRMKLAAALPGGTATERVKAKAFAAGAAHSIASIVAALEGKV